MGDKRTYKRFLAIALIALACLLSVLSLTPANAQAPSLVQLFNTEDKIRIGQQTYITKNKDTDAKTLTRQHKHNLRGQRNKQDIINLGQTTQPVWLVFSVKNTVQNENWSLHLGSLLDGRTALIKNIEIFNGETGKNLFEINQENTLGTDIIPFKIPAHKTFVFAIKVQTLGIFPHTLSPFLQAQHAHHNNHHSALFSLPMFSIAALLCIGFLGALVIIQRQYEHLFFSAHIAIHILIFSLFNNQTLIAGPFTAPIISVFLIISLFVAFAGTRPFLQTRHFAETATRFFAIAGIATLVCFIVSIFLPQDYQHIASTLTLAPIIITSLIPAIFSLLLAHNERPDGLIIAASWLIWIGGLTMTALLNHNIGSTSVLALNAYWLIIIAQALLYIVASIKKTHIDEIEKELLFAKEKRAQRSKARLQQSKELADQSRLLRVIERERELMSELREREVQRTEEMRTAKNAADEANRAKSAFLAVVSHEVRTPMNGIMGMIRLMSDSQMTKQQHEYLQAMQTSGETMMALLSDILDFEKIESGNLTLETIDFDMSKIVQDVVTLMTGHAAEKDTILTSKVSPTFPATLKGDPTRIRQILLNLVSNAIKFTEKGRVTIELNATPSKKEDGTYHVTCAVEDTGIGISKEAQETLFTPFTQASESTTREYGGTGLGLTICRKLVEAMKGKIDLVSEEGKGSTFSFTLPLQLGKSNFKENAGDIGEAKRAKPKPISILIIDDNEMNRRVLKGFLEKDGHTITGSEDAEHALQLCSEKNFDLIITDIQLKGMSGVDFTKNLRIFPNKKIASMPVIALSGNTSQKDIKSYYQANINGFLPKPIDPDALNDVLFRAQNGDFDQKIILPEKASTQPQPQQSEPSAQPEIKLDKNTSDIEKAMQTMQKEKVVAAKFKIDETGSIQQEQTFETLDLKILESMTGNIDKDTVMDLINSCAEYAKKTIEELQSTADQKDAVIMIEKGHELKGMVANFGLKTLSELAGKIEQAGKDGDTETGADAITRLPETYKITMKDLNAWIEQL